MAFHKNLIVRISLSFILVLTPNYSMALSLEEAIAMAKKKSLDAEEARMKYQQSKLSYMYYKSNRKPSISLTSTPVQYNADVVQRYSYSEDRTYYRTQKYLYSTANLRLMQNVNFLGGYFYVDSDLRLFNSLGNDNYSQFTTIPLRIGYSQNLVGYNSFKWDHKIEPLTYTIAENEFLHSMEDIASDVSEKYLAICLLREEAVLAESSLHKYDTLCHVAEQEFKSGRIEKKIYAEILLERSKARVTALQNNLSLQEATDDLKRYIGLPRDYDLFVSMHDILLCINDIIDIPIDNAIQLALLNSSNVI